MPAAAQLRTHLPPPRLSWPLAYCVQGTQRGAAAGFKLDTLLKLADVKGTDRKTSLLHFVITQAGLGGRLHGELWAARPVIYWLAEITVFP